MAGQRPLRGSVALSAGLLVAGVAGLAARAEVIQRHWDWAAYRQSRLDAAKVAAQDAARHLPDTFTTVPRPGAVSLSSFLAGATTPGLTILTVGALAILLVAAGRRFSWLALTVAALFIAPGIQVLDSYESWAPGVGRAAAVLVIAGSVLPVLVATRSVQLARRPAPRPVLVVAASAVMIPDLIAFAGPNNVNVPQPLATLAVFGYGVLVASSRLPRRWLPAALVVPVLGLPAVSFAINDGLYANGWDTAPTVGLTLGLIAYALLVAALPLPHRWLPLAVAIPLVGLPQLRGAIIDGLYGTAPSPPSFVWPLALTIGLAAFGAAVPLLGPRVLALWRGALQHGPTLLSGPTEATT